LTTQETFYGKEIVVADRDMVETDSDAILKDADKVDVSFLVVGDPFGCVFPPAGAHKCFLATRSHLSP
jgi:diphthamide biosynthesis methyltransferase